MYRNTILKSSAQNTKFLAIVLLLVVLAIGAVYFIEMRAQSEFNTIKHHYQNESSIDSKLIVKNIEQAFQEIYQDIRTISYLPSVRNINKQNQHLNPDAIEVIQQIYNNLASNVAVSEVYINSIDFNPDKINPYTRKPEEPIVMFDEIIVGRSADTNKEHTAIHPEQEITEEIEIYEYREIRKQLDIFVSQHPNINTFTEFMSPALSSNEVITCDNSHYSHHTKNDDDRSGIIYSVPFYGFDGKLKGSISAIILTHAIRDLLPEQNSAISNSVYNYTAISKNSNQIQESQKWVSLGSKDPSLYFSEVLPIASNDLNSTWKLWVGHPNSELNNRRDIKAITQFRIISHISVAILLMFSIQLIQLFRQNYLLQAKALEEAEEVNKMKSEFLASMTHELRTPMHAILNYAKLGIGKISIIEQEGVRDKLDKYLNNISLSGDRLLRLINNLLDLSKLNAGMMVIAPKNNDLYDISKQSANELDILLQDKNLTINITKETDKTTGNFDKEKIQQVIINLLSNAIKFSPKDSSIDISIEKQTDSLIFNIKDEGIGIPENELKLVFDEFLQSSKTKSNDGGTGLGLSICKKIITAHEGNITANNNPNSGATFSFTIPTG